MKLTVEKTHLNQALKLVSRVMKARATLPIIQDVHLEVRGNHLRVTGTNLEATVQVVVAGSGGEDGAVCVPPKPLIAALGGGPGAVEIASVEKPTGLSIKAGAATATMNGVPAAEFPPTATPATTLGELDAAILGRGISQCLHSVASDDTRPVLTALCADLWGTQGIKIAAVDGFRLSVYNHGPQDGDAVRLLIPRDTAKLLGIILKEAAPTTASVAYSVDTKAPDRAALVSLRVVPTKTRLGILNVVITSRLELGTYPNYMQLIPTGPTTTVAVSHRELLAAQQGAAVLASEGSGIIRLSVNGSALVVSANNQEAGSFSQLVQATLKGAPGKIALSSNYLLEMLGALHGETVALELTSPSALMVWSDPDDPDYLEAIMPMFVQ